MGYNSCRIFVLNCLTLGSSKDNHRKLYKFKPAPQSNELYFKDFRTDCNKVVGLLSNPVLP